MIIRKATIRDIEKLIQARIDYFAADNRLPTEEECESIRQNLRPYFIRHIPTGECICMLAEVDDKIAATAFFVISERPASPVFVSGRIGTVLNVLTYPPYRKRGIATKLVEALIEEGKKAGIAMLELTATEEGEFLYKKLGFDIPKRTFMRLPLQ